MRLLFGFCGCVDVVCVSHSANARRACLALHDTRPMPKTQKARKTNFTSCSRLVAGRGAWLACVCPHCCCSPFPPPSPSPSPSPRRLFPFRPFPPPPSPNTPGNAHGSNSLSSPAAYSVEDDDEDAAVEAKSATTSCFTALRHRARARSAAPGL